MKEKEKKKKKFSMSYLTEIFMSITAIGKSSKKTH
jgi:hypothetical protein